MTEKEIAELRRRFRPEKNNITQIRGCYVNEKREIVTEISQSLNVMQEDEAESILSVLKRTLSGGVGKNLRDITFDTAQVVDSEEHKLLMALRSSALKDEDAVQTFFQRVIDTLNMGCNYLILLTHDVYDVPYRSKDGEAQADASSEVFSYILCSVCPIKATKPALSYYITQNEFHNCKQDWLVAAPELGFLFPAFTDRCADIYSALYYSRDIAENHQDFVDAVFRRDMPMPAAAQKETFVSILADTLAEDCSYDVVQTVHEKLCELIVEHKANKEEEPLVVSKGTVRQVLQTCGVAEEHVAAFDAKYDAEFGVDVDLSPQNIINVKQLEVRTPEVSIQVSPEHSGLLETRIIDGIKYILIRADEGVAVNGINVHITA